MNKEDLEIKKILKRGTVIPAHPLALDKNRRFDETGQRRLTMYYISAGAGGLSIGVHTTQFEIHNSKFNLYKPVLRVSSETVKEIKKPVIMIAGIYGETKQAIKEAEIAKSFGYHAGLLILTQLKNQPTEKIIKHIKEISKIIDIFGFYLQPSIGGKILDFKFWCKFLEIENILGIKIAPFNRYWTLDVVKAVIETGRENDVALYTGNDDNIIFDLITPFYYKGRKVRIVGGLLGHWSFWTKKAVELLKYIHSIIENKYKIPYELMKTSVEITDCNSAIFDSKNNFDGCIPGINEVLRRSGLLKERKCLNPNSDLSTGQKEEIDRIYKLYPHLRDDEFVKMNFEKWC
ncbi:MAG: dihydrodipicolinate synthase family protein [Candidatus Omnitrophica bacterium]|nr:dihydrodipicolinate synthase family protein [Candidatus Omnitrophota bacterium]